MWLSRNTKVFDSFLPQKWEVNNCSVSSGLVSLDLLGFTENQPCQCRDRNKGQLLAKAGQNLVLAGCFALRKTYFSQTF